MTSGNKVSKEAWRQDVSARCQTLRWKATIDEGGVANFLPVGNIFNNQFIIG